VNVSADLARRISHTHPRLLVPSGVVAPDRLTLVDAWTLPAGGPPLILALAEDAERRWHALPLVDDAPGLRRAREGDGWATAAVGVVLSDSVAADAEGTGFTVRQTRPDVTPDVGGFLSEFMAESSPVHEVVVVGKTVRIRLDLLPRETVGSAFDAISHLRMAGLTAMGPSAGDIIWVDPERWVAPIVGVAEPLAGMPLDEAFGRAASRHLRGGDDPEPTLVLARGLARLLADLHVALATSTKVAPQPLTMLTAPEAAAMSRAARDSVAEAAVLTDKDTQQHVRSRRQSMREAFQPLADAVGSPLLPAVPFVSLGQAYISEESAAKLHLDPLQLTSAEPTRPAVADVAALLRAVNHVAHGALRRLVGGGESVPVERVSTWALAVRELVLSEYRLALAEADQSALFDERLLLGLEIEAECRALSYAARTLSTWSTVPDAGLLELLPPD
jgi:hypothetical protein